MASYRSPRYAEQRWHPAASHGVQMTRRKAPSGSRASGARENRLVYVILAEDRLILPEAQAPQPDQDVHDGAPQTQGCCTSSCGPGRVSRRSRRRPDKALRCQSVPLSKHSPPVQISVSKSIKRCQDLILHSTLRHRPRLQVDHASLSQDPQPPHNLLAQFVHRRVFLEANRALVSPASFMADSRACRYGAGADVDQGASGGRLLCQ